MDVIGVLEDLIAIDSINPFTCHQIDPDRIETWKLEGNETAISTYLEKKLKEAGFIVKKQFVHRDIKGKAFDNLLGEKGTGDCSLLFYGHMDTVTAKPWLSREHALTPQRIERDINGEKKETIVGLGSSD